MKVHHLNLGSMHLTGGPLVRNRARTSDPPLLVCHALLLETGDGLVLVDTGFGVLDLAEPERRIGRLLLALTRPDLDPSRTAAARVEALGFAREDVRHVVVTHLDVDHAGGLPDFPAAKVHVMEGERDAAVSRRAFMHRLRYRPHQWAHGPAWECYDVPRGERWKGFESVRPLRGLPPEVLLVPLAGHSPGHAAVAVDRGAEGVLLHCGDAYFHRDQLHPTRPRCPPALAAFQRLVAEDREALASNQARLRDLANDPAAGVRVFSAHDPEELAAFEP